MVGWALFASRRPLKGVVAAGDQDQAGFIRDAIERLVACNPWLAGGDKRPAILEVQRQRVINPATGSELSILTSDAPTSYGLTPDFIIADEAGHWANRDLWDSLFSAAAKRKNCLFVVITNAGFQQSWQWPLREAIRTDADWYFHRLDGPQASWITADRLEEQRRLLPALSYRRLWLNEWGSGSGDAIAEDDILAAVKLGGPAVAPEPGWIYLAGADLGLKRDASAIALIAKHVGHVETIEDDRPRPPLPLATRLALSRGEIEESQLTGQPQVRSNRIEGTGKIKLVSLSIFKPGANGGTVDVGSIEAALLALHGRFRLAGIACDPWQALDLIQRLNEAGINAEPVDFTGPNLKSMAQETLAAFVDRRIELFPDPALLTDLRNLRVVEKSYGIRLESPRTSGGAGTRHGDTATALSIALHVAKRFAFGPAPTVQGPLMCW